MLRTIGAILFSAVLAACGNATETGDRALAAVQEGALLIDVRTAEEFATGHLPGAINIPHGDIVDGLAALKTPVTKDVVLYCRSGNRSGLATRSLEEAGFSKVLNAGAYSALRPLWAAAGS